MEHDEFAVNIIRKASVHFRLRRTTPTLYRHRATCLSSIRTFAAIDDGVRIAQWGVKWMIDDVIVTCLAVVCLGYIDTDAMKSKKKLRSAKVEDVRSTHVVVRPATDGKFIAHTYTHTLTHIHTHTLTHTQMTCEHRWKNAADESDAPSDGGAVISSGYPSCPCGLGKTAAYGEDDDEVYFKIGKNGERG